MKGKGVSGIVLPSEKKNASSKASAVPATTVTEATKKPARKVITYRTTAERQRALAVYAFENETSVQLLLDQALLLLAAELDISLPDLPDS